VPISLQNILYVCVTNKLILNPRDLTLFDFLLRQQLELRSPDDAVGELPEQIAHQIEAHQQGQKQVAQVYGQHFQNGIHPLSAKVSNNVQPDDIEQDEGDVARDAGQSTWIAAEAGKQVHDGQKGHIRVHDVI